MVWDGRGGVRPERLARRRRLAVMAATVAMAVAVPAVVGSSAGWWSGSSSVQSGAGSSDVGSRSGLGGGQVGADADGLGSLVPDLLDADDVGHEAGLVGIGGGLLDVGVGLDDPCTVGPPGDPIAIGILIADGVEPGSARGDDAGDGSGRGTAAEVEVGRYVAGLVNCAGGVLGRPVEVVVAEAAGSPLATNAAVAELVDRGVSAIIGPASLEVTIAAAEAAGGRIPILAPWSVEPALDDHDRGLFLIDPDAPTLAAAAAAHALDRRLVDAVVVEGADPLEGLALSSFTEDFVVGGGSVAAEVVAVVGADGSVDLGSELDRFGVGPLSQTPPDVVVSAAGAETLIGLRRALTAAGVDAPILAIDRREPSAGWASFDRSGVEVVGRRAAASDGRVAALESAVVGRPSGAAVDAVALARFADAVLIALDAVDGAGSADPEAVATQLSAPRLFGGVRGPTGVWPVRDTGVEPVPIPVSGAGEGGWTLLAELAPPIR